jgi:hypothetical protein
MIDVQSKDISKGHFYVSIVKSAVRIVAGAALIMGQLQYAGALLIFAELLGVLEEMV